MNSNPNYDYQDLMGHGTIDYPKLYDKAAHRFLTNLVHIASDRAPESYQKSQLVDKARAKRNFGLEKYGKDSFQSSLENTLNSPIVEHLEDELIDMLNYLHHIHYRYNLTGQLSGRLYVHFSDMASSLQEFVDAFVGFKDQLKELR